MNNKWTRLYNKAMNFYNDGYVNKSLEICEKILADDLSCAEVLNLKGLILYQKGLLKDARIIWNLNSDVNNDIMAEKYTEDCKNDERREKLYKEAEQNLKNLNIDRALLLFNECAESGFNSIKVNTGIAMCYLRKGDNYRAKEYVDKALSIDKEAITANKIKKELIDLGIYSDDKGKSKKILSIVTILFVAGALGAGGYSIYRKINNKDLNIQFSENSIEGDENSDQVANLEDGKDISENNTVEESDDNQNILESDDKDFDSINVLKSIEDKDLDNLYNELDHINKNNVLDQDLELYNEAVGLLKAEGVSKFYEYGVWYFNNNNYEEAEKELDKAYKYCDESYLKEHIIFYKASTALEIGDSGEALKCYKEYYSLYPKGSYIEGVLYELSLLTYKTNKDVARQYAEELMNNYPDSLYINDRIRDIIQ